MSGELAEISDQVGLIVITAIGSDLRPFAVGAFHGAEDLLKAQNAAKQFRSQADFAQEAAFQLASAEAQVIGQCVHGSLAAAVDDLRNCPLQRSALFLAGAQTIEQEAADPLAYAAAFQDWTRKTITVWYSGSVQADAAKSEQMARAYRGEDAPPPPTMGFGPALAALSKDDPGLGLRYARLNHLLDPPFAMFSDPSVMARIQDYIAMHPAILPKEALSRRDFEKIVAG